MQLLYITCSDYKRVENTILVGITPQWGYTVSNGTYSYIGKTRLLRRTPYIHINPLCPYKTTLPSLAQPPF
jgi:hypothetical protein